MNLFDMNYTKSAQQVLHHYIMFEYYKNTDPNRAKMHYDKYYAAVKNYATQYGDRILEANVLEERPAPQTTVPPFGNYQNIKGPGLLRIFNALPNDNNYAVFVNDKLFFPRFTYKQLTQYFSLPDGLYQLKITDTNNQNDVILTKNIQILPNIATTAALIDGKNGAELSTWNDSIDVENDEAKVRFAHLAKNAPNVDISVIDGDTIFTNVPYKSMTDYLVLTPVILGIQAKNAQTKETILEIPSLELQGSTAYTLLAIEGKNSDTPVEVVVLTYIDK